jgi:predicted ATPase with chaperone activity
VEGVERVPGLFAARCAGYAERRGDGVTQREPFRVSTEKLLEELPQFTVDFKDVRGQQRARRAYWRLRRPGATTS